MEHEKKIKVLIIDNSKLAREILVAGLSKDPMLEPVSAEPDEFLGHDIISEYNPDVIALNIEMPGIDGIEFLRMLVPQFYIPIVVISSLTQKGKHLSLHALEAGAVEFVAKPIADISRGLFEMMNELIVKIKIASTAKVSNRKNYRFYVQSKRVSSNQKTVAENTDKVVAIGVSTCGTEALRKVLTQLPATMPGVVVVQHMPSGFTKTLADRFNELSIMQVKEAETGDRILTGRVLIAPGDYHLRVIRSEGYYHVVCENGEKVNDYRPSVDVMMLSVAEHVGSNAIGIILTGNGNDGALGLKAMKNAGAQTICQNENTSIIYDMPRAALEIGAVDNQLALDDIPSGIVNLVQKSRGMLF